jgi:hypothetical protein
MVVAAMSAPLVPVVSQDNLCGGTFHVILYIPGGSFTAGEFQFIAREDAPQHS